MNHHEEQNIMFSEVQQFRQWWVWGVIVIAAGFCWYTFIKQVLFGVQVSNRPAPNSVVIVLWLIIGIGVPLLFWPMKLITQVRTDGVYVRMAPIHWAFQAILFADLQDYTVHNYRPLRDYSGWGIRYGRTGKAYTVSGNRGVLFTLTDGNRILIGSQRSNELAQAVQHSKDNA
jgi:hypothetical protein